MPAGETAGTDACCIYVASARWTPSDRYDGLWVPRIRGDDGYQCREMPHAGEHHGDAVLVGEP